MLRSIKHDCSPLGEVKLNTRISVGFAAGFTYAPLYHQFRRKFSVEDHCVTLHGYGLSPDATLIRPLSFILLPVFEIAAQALDAANGPFDNEKFNAISNRSVTIMSRVFPLFGAKWLATEEPEEVSDKQRLLTLSMCYLADIVVAEVGRQIGFLKGCYGIVDEKIFPIACLDWPEIGSQIATNLLKRVAGDWNMPMPPDTTGSGAPGTEGV